MPTTRLVDPDNLDPPNLRDWNRVEPILEDMRIRGWHGSPLIVDGRRALTGSHRIEAAKLADIHKIPVVDFDELMRELGHNPADFRDDSGRADWMLFHEVLDDQKWGL